MKSVYVVQKAETPVPEKTITGIITEKVNKSGKAFKFKKASQEDGGKKYSILKVSKPYGPFPDDPYKNLTYYLDIQEGEELPLLEKVPSPYELNKDWKLQVETSIKALKKEFKELHDYVHGTENPKKGLTPTEKEELSSLDF